MNKTALKITSEVARSLLVGRRTRRLLKNLCALGVSVVALCVLLAAFPVQPAQADDLAPGYWEQSPLPQTGLATFYASGMMEYVAGYRQSQGQLPSCPECVGTVALLRAGDIGRKVWLQPPDGERVGPFLVIDCARRQDVDPLVARGWAVDVSYELGQAWAMNRPLAGVTVLEDPADAGVRPMRLVAPTPFYVPPGDVVITAPTATPAVTEAAPTPWPTRIPAGMASPGATAEPASTPAPPALRLPPPLTPIVTTPTPEVTLTPAPPAEANAPSSAPAASTETPVSVEAADVSVGRAGGGLLEPESVLTPAPVAIWPTPTATPRTPVRTPRPDLTPILPMAGETPTPAVGPESPLMRLWREMLGRVLP
jgi:hypothetical protein